jgi:exodeoxyribonuclease VII large subunit
MSEQITIEFETKVAPPQPQEDWRAKVPSVSQLTRRIRGHIENTFFDVWVKGEISNFRKPVSGHAYFVLKDATSQIKAVMFRNSLSKVKIDIKDGTEVLLHGTISVYEARGEYQIVADQLEPVGVGALQLAFQQLKEKLKAEGLFNPEHKKKLPFLPRRIGMVTSATGAAVRDVLKVLSRRFPNLEFFVIPASVQGEKAAPEIVAGIERAEKWNIENPKRKIDVLIVGRGGGSLEDMWSFNEEIVARAIYKCNIPIISAVGHEIDFTIADFVADLRAPTPSAAAEIVVPKKEELQYIVKSNVQKMNQLIKKQLQQTKLHLDHLSRRLQDPKQKILKVKDRVKVLNDKLMQLIKMKLMFARKKVESQAQLLNSLSPLNIVGRGYSLTQTASGVVVMSSDDVQVDDVVLTKLKKGSIKSKVIEKTPR